VCLSKLKSNDGVIEGLELINSETIIIGVQFHPEILLAEGNENIIHFVDKFKENVL
jgi:gamma-glutamyl-gamma-aminobutyrate hydrolase PuuD